MAFDIFFTLFLVFLNGFFVAAEFAIVKVRTSQIEILAKDGNRAAGMTKKILKQLDGYLAATQLGITIASLGLGWIGKPVVAGLILGISDNLGLNVDTNLANQIALPVAFLLITVLHIVFGELAPKSLAIQRPISTSLAVSFPLHFFYVLFRPFIWLLNGFANFILKSMGIQPAGSYEVHSPEELEYILEQGKESGALEASEHEMIQNVFDFQDRIVKNIMIPRTQISAIDINTPSDEVLGIVVREGYTRMPVFDKVIDNIVGIIHTKDILAKIKANEEISLRKILRKAFFTPETKKISDLLTDLRQKTNPSMAIVLDEFGGTAGIVSLEDIVEELVGEIQDEYDEEKPLVETISETEFVVNALAPISDVNEFLPLELPEDDDYDTVAGFMNVIFERIPEVGDNMDHSGYHFSILKTNNRKVETVRLVVLNPLENEN